MVPDSNEMNHRSSGSLTNTFGGLICPPSFSIMTSRYLVYSETIPDALDSWGRDGRVSFKEIKVNGVCIYKVPNYMFVYTYKKVPCLFLSGRTDQGYRGSGVRKKLFQGLKEFSSLVFDLRD